MKRKMVVGTVWGTYGDLSYAKKEEEKTDLGNFSLPQPTEHEPPARFPDPLALFHPARATATCIVDGSRETYRFARLV